MSNTHLPELHNGIVTNWMPLTTPAPKPYPSSCFSALRLETLSETVSNFVAFDPWYGQAIDTKYRECLVPEHTVWWAQQKAPSTVLNLGPFACPTPYTTAAVSTVTAGTTLIACCPSNYAYQGEILPPLSGRQCFSKLTSGQVVVAKTSAGPEKFGVTTATITETHLGVYGNQINGFVFGKAPATSSSAGASSNSGASPTASPTGLNPSIMTGIPNIAGSTSGTIAPEQSAQATTSSLSSTGAKVGVGIGVSAAVIAIFCLIGFFMARRRRAARRRSGQTDDREPIKGVPAVPARPERDLPPLPRTPPKPPQELSSEVEYFEVEANERKSEKQAIEMWA